MNFKFFTFALLAPLCLPAFASPLVEVKKIATKTEAEVAKVLGSPGTCEKIKQGKKCDYRKQQIEVVYIRGKADWITVSGLSQIPFAVPALRAIGLEESEPTSRNPFLLRWEPGFGFKSVSIFKGQGGVDYAYIKAITP